MYCVEAVPATQGYTASVWLKGITTIRGTGNAGTDSNIEGARPPNSKDTP